MGRRASVKSAFALAIALLSVSVVTAPARAALVTLFALPPSLKNPDRISPGPDGVIWFTQYDPDRDGPQASILGRITTAGRASAVPLPAGSVPRAITSGPDGALWYAAAGAGGGRLGRVLTAPAGEFALPPGSSSARGIVTGPDGALWFTTQQRIGRLVPGAAMSFVRVPGAKDLQAIDRGADDALWFSDRDDAAVRRITTTGTVRRFRLPVGSGVGALAAARDGSVWVVTEGPSRLARVTPSGRVSTYALPQTGNVPGELTAGPDGAMWFTHLQGIGRITSGGEMTELAVPQPDDEPTFSHGLTSGPDGAIWFGQRTSSNTRGEIGRIDIAGQAGRLLVTRLDDRRLRGRAGRTLRVAFSATRDAIGSLRLDLGRQRAIVRQRVRARAGPNRVTVRLPRRASTYRLILRLSLGSRVATTSLGAVRSQSASDSAALTITRRTPSRSARR